MLTLHNTGFFTQFCIHVLVSLAISSFILQERPFTSQEIRDLGWPSTNAMSEALNESFDVGMFDLFSKRKLKFQYFNISMSKISILNFCKPYIFNF